MTSGTSPALARVAAGELCSGCGACAAIAPGSIEMRLSEEGFLRPVQNSTIAADAEERIGRACPGLGLARQRIEQTDHPLWGAYAGVYTGFATDPELRRNASSGGALSALLMHLLQSGEVDGVIQVGADPALPFGNRTVLSVSDDEVFASAGSRYAPSAPVADIAGLLDGNLRHAFVGKPCDVAALRAMSRDDPRIVQRIPWMLSFFCAGVPSHAGAREVLDRMGVDEAEVVRFRYRGDGWPGYATATLRDGQERRMSYADSWGGVLSRHLQARCKICPDGIGAFADIVCADAWETDARGYPVFEERDGVSLVLSRTERGEALVQAAAAAERLAIAPFDIDTLQPMQPGQTRKRQLTLARLAALRLLGRPIPSYRGMNLVRNARSAGLRPFLRNFLGTLRRGLLGKF